MYLNSETERACQKNLKWQLKQSLQQLHNVQWSWSLFNICEKSYTFSLGEEGKKHTAIRTI
jgi:hypothetical protein